MIQQRTLIIILLFCFLSMQGSAQVMGKTYPVVIQFNSECCGVPADSVLRGYVTDFKRSNNLKKFSAIKIGPMGREGEYWLAFGLAGLQPAQKHKFRQGMKKLAEQLKSPGYAVYEENRKIVKADLPIRATLETVNF